MQMQYADELFLVEQCKANYRLAQRTIYDRYAPLFFTICKRYAKDHLESEQLMQDSFLKIFQNIQQFQGKGSFEGWMKKILVNTCLDHVKSKQFKQEQLTVYADDVHETFNTVSFNDAINNIDAAPLFALIQSLPPTTQAVFNLYVFEGYSHKEISNMLTMSVGTSQWHVNNARNTLKVKLENILNTTKINHEESRIG